MINQTVSHYKITEKLGGGGMGVVFAAFGHDDIGTIGTSTTINSGDMQGILMIAVQALEKRLTRLEQVLTAQQSLAAVTE